jgi:hypothetical protein
MDLPQPDAIALDVVYTPRGLVERIRKLSGGERTPIGERILRRAIRRGELRAVKLGNRHLIRWGDYLE